jgi:predicted metal-dependent phosphoesterase TrpH
MSRARQRPTQSISSGADLHLHTTHSDGAYSPCEVVRAAAQAKLAAIAITDHDTLSAFQVAQPEALRLEIELIPGIELTAEFEDREVHILGHFVDPANADLLAATHRLHQQRLDRLEAMVDRLAQFGYRVDLAGITRAFPRATLGRRHLAEWLVQTAQISNHRLAFSQLLGDDRPAHVPKPRLSHHHAIRLIRDAGGVAGLAHPPHSLQHDSLLQLKLAGLEAIEVDSPAVDRRRGARFRDWASEFDLVPIAGTDFHAPRLSRHWIGSIRTPSADLERLRNRRPTHSPPNETRPPSSAPNSTATDPLLNLH